MTKLEKQTRRLSRAIEKEQRELQRKRKREQKERAEILKSPSKILEEKKTKRIVKILLGIMTIQIIVISTEISLLMEPKIVYAMTSEQDNPKSHVLEEAVQENSTFYSPVMRDREIILTAQDIIYLMNPNMDISGPSGIGKIEFEILLSNIEADKASFFKKYAGTIWEIAKEYQINEFVLCGIIAEESKYGTYPNAIRCNNYVGMKRDDGSLIEYESVEQGLRAVANNLAQNYLTEGGKYYKGKTLKDVNIRYCTSSNEWAGKVYSIARKILEGQV